MQILTLNAGSSSLKAALYWLEEGRLSARLRADLTGLGREKAILQLTTDHQQQHFEWNTVLGTDQILGDCVDLILSHVDEGEKLVFSHRVVHGGTVFSEAQLVNTEVLSQLKKFISLAPLHQPHNLHLIELVRARHPEILSVACFDTMFHASQPELEACYALPKAVRDLGIRRYGFHGLSYEFIAQHLQLANQPDSRNVVLHLGAGASACAMRGALSQATSMGFSAVDGLPMGSRTGQLDPGVLLFLLAEGWTLEQLENLLYRESGWLGLSGTSSDMQQLLDSDKATAKFAVEHFCYHIALEIGRLSAALEGIDNLIFTGGIGAHSAEIRNRVAKRLNWLGVKLDSNATGELISHNTSKVRVYAIETNEELMLAQHAADIIKI